MVVMYTVSQRGTENIYAEVGTKDLDARNKLYAEPKIYTRNRSSLQEDCDYFY